MIGAYSVAIGDFYIGFATYSLSITRYYNPYLPLTLFFSESHSTSYLLDKLARELDVQLIQVDDQPWCRWSANFLKWEVDFSCLGDLDYCLYLDADAFLTGPLTESEVREVATKPLMIAQHPDVEKVLKMDEEEIWTTNKEAAYFVPQEYRKMYYNAGVVLGTIEGLNFLQGYMKQRRVVDESQNLFRTSPFFDENYVNRFALVDHPEKVVALPWYWDQFCKLYPENFHICHLAAHGTILPGALDKMRFARKKCGVVNQSFQERFFPEDYFNTGWLMEPTDRFVLLGLLTALRPRKIVWIGVWEGKDLEPFRRRHPETEVHILDIKDSRLRSTAMEEGWFHLHLGDSRKLLPDLLADVKPDVIFVDGSHNYEVVSEDLENSLSLCPCTVVFGHDIHYPPIRRAVKEVEQKHSKRKLHVLETPITYKFGDTYGGFFVFDSVERDFEKL